MLVTSPQWPILVLGEFLYVSVYMYIHKYTYICIQLTFCSKLTHFLYCVFVKDIQVIEIILRPGIFSP